MSWIFDSKYWLKPGISWSQMPTNYKDLIYPLYFAIPLVVFRLFWESFIGVTWLWYRDHYGKTSLSENIFHHLTGGFASNSKQKRMLAGFARLSFYIAATIYGIIVLWDKSWLWNVEDCWIDYPFHHAPDSIWWYYMLECGFYYSLLIASIWDDNKSDFWEMTIHHCVTIGLLSASWTVNYVRVGTLVLLSHDTADVFLEFSKFVRLDFNNNFVTNSSTITFLIVWSITRLVYYPLVVIRSSIYDAPSIIFPEYQILNFTQAPYVPRLIILLLVVLFILHILWTYIILKIVISAINASQPLKDLRSDTEYESEDENGLKRKKAGFLN